MAFMADLGYNFITKGSDNMKFSDKLIKLRKSQGLSQEDLAEKLNVSRQAISRWEGGSAMPDAENILKISRIFNVTADYLLNDDYESDGDVPKIKEIKNNSTSTILFCLVMLGIMLVIIQFVSVVVLKSWVFSIASFVLFLMPIIGFEYSYRKCGNAESNNVRIRLYKILAWMGTYFPVRFIFLAINIMNFRIAFEITVLAVYIAAATAITISLESLRNK